MNRHPERNTELLARLREVRQREYSVKQRTVLPVPLAPVTGLALVPVPVPVLALVLVPVLALVPVPAPVLTLVPVPGLHRLPLVLEGQW